MWRARKYIFLRGVGWEVGYSRYVISLSRAIVLCAYKIAYRGIYYSG